MTKLILPILVTLIIVSGHTLASDWGAEPEAPTHKDKCGLLKIARRVITGDEKVIPNKNFDVNEAKEIAVLTFFTDDGEPLSTTGLADDRKDAVAQAALMLQRTAQFKALKKESVGKGRIALDIILQKEYVKVEEAEKWVEDVVLGTDGFIYYDGNIGVIFSPAFPIYYGFTEKPLFLQYVVDTIQEILNAFTGEKAPLDDRTMLVLKVF